MLRHKLSSLLRIFSLGLGVGSVVVLIFISINEYSKDTFYENSDNIYALFDDFKSPDYSGTTNTITQKYVPALVRDFPQIQSGTVVYNNQKTHFKLNKDALELNTLYADSDFFEVFKREFILGDKGVLNLLNSAVITKKTAKTLFGNTENAIGKILKLDAEREIVVKAVIEDWPANSSFTSDIIISFATLKDQHILYMEWDGGDSFNAYVLFADGTDVKSIEKELPKFQQKYYDRTYDETKGFSTHYYFVPISKANIVANPSLKPMIFLFIVIALVIFILVNFNYLIIIISQQNSFKKEIYIQRAVGASISDLRIYTLQDSILYIALSSLVAMGFIYVISPFVESLFNFSIISVSYKGIFPVIISSLFIITFLLNYFVPFTSILQLYYSKNIINRNPKIKSIFKSSLLSFQITTSIILAVFMYVIYLQFNFISNFDKGYNSSNLVYIELNSEELYSKDKLIKGEILKLPNVFAASLSDGLPVWGISGNGFFKNSAEEELKICRNLYVDKDFFNCLGIKLKGNTFNDNDENSVIITESVAKIMGLEQIVGNSIFRGRELRIKAKCNDIAAYSIHSKMQPIVFSHYQEPSSYSVLSIRLNNKDIIETIHQIKSRIEALVPNQIVQIKFYDQQLRENYEFDRAVQKTISFFSLLAAIITLAGLIGFTMQNIESRTKELAIRKVNGASQMTLLYTLNKIYVFNTLVSILIALPIAFYISSLWLEAYAYSIKLSYWIFILAAIISLLIIGITVSLFTIKIIRQNPVKSLRYE
jgi:putative ABC transport system permease protein